MTAPYPSEATKTDVGSASVGELVGQVATDLSTLMRQEVQLAKAELQAEASKAGKGAGLIGGAGYAGLLLGVFASLTLAALLDLAMPEWTAYLIVTLLWAATALFLFTKGKAQLKHVHGPTQTIDSLKETRS
jgi:hypothetical protein